MSQLDTTKIIYFIKVRIENKKLPNEIKTLQTLIILKKIYIIKLNSNF